MITKVFGADNCAGCKVVKRRIEQLGVAFVDFDVNKYEDMEEAMIYNIRSIPTLVVEDDAGKHVYVGEKNCLEGINAHLLPEA